MPVKAFHAVLRDLMEAGDLTVADLHHWFDRPRPTVRAWVELEREPRGPAGKDAWRRLRLLEHVVDCQRGLPAPRSLSATQRPAYIRRIRDELEHAGVSAQGAAR